ncbi:hypothetical protein RAMDARK_1600 [Rickettsia amblyommatis str. Darkwater]|uniref:Uncharacterized protein n=2 Tax=Rickettsia amblyommatis TaxID=33989 RepID=H8K3A9_RICAG|nr:hypothetical protein [Rickettsia amblyommatis]AFC70301.1 hypothetical protein MCE_07635 [Rickettsia amblyommatis str. GAT-30V]KJV61140.1 hypothetical protein APHACPA_0141 [Rickettsia amblyommatis str. Ac/Pa]KJV88826.1 hypothetical protein RAMDARK_1600 [Rickettsia amblyommatis str. Darkwater]
MGLKSISNYFKELIKDPNLEQNINLEKEAKLVADKHRLTKYIELSDNKNNNAVFSGKKHQRILLNYRFILPSIQVLPIKS